jgi:hypothetical protein
MGIITVIFFRMDFQVSSFVKGYGRLHKYNVPLPFSQDCLLIKAKGTASVSSLWHTQKVT